ncbi:MAG: aminotransferase IV, partial [Chlorobi bacterium]|nr:aminotransferase IV [Chlorobiota bacterium]
MPNKKYFILNGAYVAESEMIFDPENRAFLYGDTIFETIKAVNGNILFFNEHINRLTAGMSILNYNIPDKFTFFKEKLKEEISGLLNRNKIFKAARIRINVFRKSGGLYSPKTDNVNYFISASKLENEYFILNKTGLHLGIYTEIKKPINVFSPFKTANSLIYVLAGIYTKQNNFDDCIILNEKNEIAESVSSNIFAVINKTLITPGLNSGCINGIIRNEIIKTAERENISVKEKTLTENDLLNAEEIFLTNSISGIKWAVAYKNKRYY